jgi:integrase
MSLRPGQLHLGYVRAHKDKPGIWTVRSYLGDVRTIAKGRRGGRTPYRIKRLPGVADDYETANGSSVLSFAQAQDLALAPPKVPGHAAGPLTVAGACAAYVRRLRHERRAGSAREAVQRLRKHLRGIRSTPVAELTPEKLRGWLADLAGRLARGADEEAVRRSRASANRVLTMLRAALNHAYAEGLTASDAGWRGRVRPFGEVGRARQRYLTVEEAQRLINASEGALRALITAALQTGARYGELARLRVHDFNPDSGTVHVAKSKSGRARDIVVTEEGEAFFRQIAAGRPGGALLLPHPGGGAWQRIDQQRPMRRAVERAKIDPVISFHGLRHTYASLSVMGGVPLQVVAQNLGHTDTRMVEKHYGHLAKSYKREAIRKGAPRFGVEPDATVRPLRHK